MYIINILTFELPCQSHKFGSGAVYLFLWEENWLRMFVSLLIRWWRRYIVEGNNSDDTLRTCDNQGCDRATLDISHKPFGIECSTSGVEIQLSEVIPYTALTLSSVIIFTRHLLLVSCWFSALNGHFATFKNTSATSVAYEGHSALVALRTL